MAQWPRSSRNEKTGPGSRGGKGLDPTYWRRYRAEHPEYVERERIRMRKRDRSKISPVTFSDACRQVVREELEIMPLRDVAARLMVGHTVLLRWLRGAPTFEDTLDAIVAVYGWERVRTARAKLRRAGLEG